MSENQIGKSANVESKNKEWERNNAREEKKKILFLVASLAATKTLIKQQYKTYCFSSTLGRKHETHIVNIQDRWDPNKQENKNK